MNKNLTKVDSFKYNLNNLGVTILLGFFVNSLGKKYLLNVNAKVNSFLKLRRLTISLI